jgi:hypothetical protein
MHFKQLEDGDLEIFGFWPKTCQFIAFVEWADDPEGLIYFPMDFTLM